MITREWVARLACGALIGLHALPAAASSSYAVQVLRYEPGYSGGCVPSHTNFIDAQAALGPANYSGGASGTGAVALGSGGLIELLLSPGMSNSGDERNDLRILEVGGFDEACFVSLRPAPMHTAQEMLMLGLEDTNHDGFYEIKRIGGGSSYVDIDRYLPLGTAGQSLHFDAVQIIDDADDHSACTSTSGGDIDYVEALDPFVAVAPGSWSQIKVLYRD